MNPVNQFIDSVISTKDPNSLSNKMGSALTGIGQAVADRFLYDPKTKTPLPSGLYNRFTPEMNAQRAFIKHPSEENKQAYINAMIENAPIVGGMTALSEVHGGSINGADLARTSAEDKIKLSKDQLQAIKDKFDFGGYDADIRKTAVDLSKQNPAYIKALQKWQQQQRINSVLPSTQGPPAPPPLPSEFMSTTPITAAQVEVSQGWAPGMKTQFDYAILNKDKETIAKLLPQVPIEYKQRFATEIKDIIGRTGKVSPFEDFDQAVSILRNKGTEPIEDVMAAHKTVMDEAAQQLTPAELAKAHSTPLEKLLDLLQKRIHPQETGMLKK